MTIVRGKVEYFTYSVCKGEDKIYFVGRDGILYAIEGREGKISWKLPLTQSWKEESFENPPICEEKKYIRHRKAL